MSGGSYDYAYGRISDLATQIARNADQGDQEWIKDKAKTSSSLRRAFAKHLLKVSAAAHAIEWNDSGDGDYNEGDLIRACLGQEAEITQVMDELREAVERGQSLLDDWEAAKK